jgi:predicted glycosyltransferase
LNFWVDIDNAPHVLVLRPIIAELQRRGHQVEITARDYGQTIPLLEMYGMRFRRIGTHGGKSMVKKYISLLTRSVALFFYAMGKRFDLVFCHGTRAVYLPAKFLRIPLVILCDYEYTSLPVFMARWITLQLFPDIIPLAAYLKPGINPQRLCGYPGVKEDLYVHDTAPDPSFLVENGMDPRKVIIIMRPPATMAHYAVPESETFFYRILDFLCMQNTVQILLLPRTPAQEDEVRTYKQERDLVNLFIPDRVHDGPGMVKCADIIVSGGGTMNREAATIGMPVYSIYQGPIGAVDRHLIETGRLQHLSTVEMLEKIPLVKRAKTEKGSIDHSGGAAQRVKTFIVERIIECAAKGVG